MRFTGGDNLTGFKRLVNDVFMKNELKNGEGAYEISFAKAGRSGYSFGPIQWDLVQNRKINDNLTVRQYFEDILRNARDLSGNPIFTNENAINDILTKVSNTGQLLSPIQKNFIDQALSSSYGIQKINETYLTELDNAINKVNGVISKVTDPENRAFLQTDLGKIFLIDYNNQFYIAPNGEMEQFIQGGTVTLGYRKTASVTGNLGIEDLLNFYLNTKYGQDKPGDLIRRFSNILEEVGISNISVTQEDINFLLGDLEELLGNRYKAILFNPDNWGIKNLISKAFALWAENSASFYGIDYWQRLQMNIVVPAQLQSYTAALAAVVPPRGDPLILDLDGDGTETAGVADGAYFDHDGNGFAERTGWAGSDDGLLAWDRNGDGIINNGLELFGDQTLLKNNTRAADGFQALAEWDDNLDGKIDVNDAVWANLKIWRDFDGDGYSSVDELYALNDLGITALNSGYTNVNITDPNGNIQIQTGTYNRTDGTAGQMNNYALRRESTYTIANEWLEVPAAIAVLPDLQAFGNVYDPPQAMVRERLMGA